jgi:hypothetical protein
VGHPTSSRTRWFGQNPSWLGVILLVGVLGWRLTHFLLERHEAREAGAAACAAKGHDATWCSAAADENGQECLPLTLDLASNNRVTQRVTRLDADGYVACLELGPNAWSRARVAAKQAAREAAKRDQQP